MTEPAGSGEKTPPVLRPPRKGRPPRARAAPPQAAADSTGEAPEAAAVAVLEPGAVPTLAALHAGLDGRYLPATTVVSEPVCLTEADRGLPWTFLAEVDAAIAASQREWDEGIAAFWRETAELHRRNHLTPQPVLLPDGPPSFSEAETALSPAVAAKEPHHGTGPHPWLDTLERELAPSEPATEAPPPPVQGPGQASDDTGTWAEGLIFPVPPKTGSKAGSDE